MPKILRYSLKINQQILKVFSPLGDAIQHWVGAILVLRSEAKFAE